MSSCRNTTSGVYLHEIKQDFGSVSQFLNDTGRRKDADEMGAEGVGDYVQGDDGAQASGTFCQVVCIQAVHIPGDQRQFGIIILWGFRSRGWTGSSQVYTAGFNKCLFIFEHQCLALV